MKTPGGVVEQLRSRAFTHKRTIVFADGTDPRVYSAASYLACVTSIHPILIGSAQSIKAMSKPLSASPDMEIYDPATDLRQEVLTEVAASRDKIRSASKRTGMAIQDMLREPVLSGALFVQSGFADGMVGGADVPTADVIRAGIRAVGLDPKCPIVSGSFAMILPGGIAGSNRVIVFGDSAVVPNPTAQQLGFITVNTADVAKTVVGLDPVVALLSFSTKGSAEDASITPIRETLMWLRNNVPDLIVDGELQADAALIPEIGQKKAPESTVAGRANVLIFPNLAAGNIAYKLVERLAGATALGVILSGLARPINDLSRGCSVDDIINMAAVTVLQGLQERHAIYGMEGRP